MYPFFAIHSIHAFLSADLDERKKECAAEFTAKLEDQMANEEAEFKLSCGLRGYPAPDIMWLFNGQAVSRDSTDYTMTYDGTSATLILHYVKPEDAGGYVCRIKVRNLGLAVL